MAPVDARFALPKTLVFGIGAQKSGTTWLGDYLAGHPDVHMSAKKEIHYWNVVRIPHDSFPAGLRERNAARARELEAESSGLAKTLGYGGRQKKIRILRAFANAANDTAAPYESYADMLMFGYGGEPVAAEITPAYARLTRDTYAEILELASDVRFVFLMRDPVSRLISALRHQQRQQNGDDAVTTRSIEDQLSRILGQDDHPMLERSRYDRTIRTLEAAVPQERVFYGFFETFFDQREIDRLCDFLGIRQHRADTDKKVFAGTDRTGLPNPDLIKEALKTLSPVYEFVAERFGKTPDAWQNARGT